MTIAILGYGNISGFYARTRETADGATAEAFLELLLTRDTVTPEDIYVFDKEDYRGELSEACERGVNFEQIDLSDEYEINRLARFVRAGDTVVNFSHLLDTFELHEWCEMARAHLVSPSVQRLTAGPDVEYDDSISESILGDYQYLASLKKKGGGLATQSSLFGYGASPGATSHFLMRGLFDAASSLLHDPSEFDGDRAQLQTALASGDFLALAEAIKLRAVHICDVDTQYDRSEVFLNNLHHPGGAGDFFDLVFSQVELCIGEHEQAYPGCSIFPDEFKQGYTVLPMSSSQCWVHTRVPEQNICGMAQRTDEIASLFLNWSKQGASTASLPTIVKITRPAPQVMLALENLEKRGYLPQERVQILAEGIADGSSTVGCLLLSDTLPPWWCGISTEIQEARQYVSRVSAGALQVAACALAAFDYIQSNESLGMTLPEELPYQQFLSAIEATLGTVQSKALQWSRANEEMALPESHRWQLQRFLHNTLDWMPRSELQKRP